MTRLVTLVLALAACTERYGGPLTVPTAGTQTPAHEPLDVTWQVGLYIFPASTLLGGGGPMGVYGAHARAIERARCSPEIVEDPDNGPPALVVIGFAEGPCDVELTYRHPVHGDMRTVMLHVVFDPPEALPELAIGSAMPAPPFVVATPQGLARCELSSSSGEFHCYVAALPFGTPRFAKAAYDMPWFNSRAPNAFGLCVRRDATGTVLGRAASSTCVTLWILPPTSSRAQRIPSAPSDRCSVRARSSRPPRTICGVHSGPVFVAPQAERGHEFRIAARAEMSAEHFRTSRTQPVESEHVGLDWNLALAGGDGTRLADYVERRFGHRAPKQYCRLLGKRTMLEHTLDRLNRIAPTSRTLTVIGTNHERFATPQLAGRCDHVFRQPASRDTGLAIYVAIAMIKRWHPNAVITITPTDHYVAPALRYVEQLAVARSVASKLREAVVILGVKPSEPDPELGYLTLGARVVEVPGVRAVNAFVEKPDVRRAGELARAGALWNTMVTCGSVHALWELARTAEPHMINILDSLVPLVGTPDEDDALEYIYRALLPVSFSRDILERSPGRLAAMELDDVEWSDWGKPERVETTLALRRAREQN